MNKGTGSAPQKRLVELTNRHMPRNVPPSFVIQEPPDVPPPHEESSPRGSNSLTFVPESMFDV